MRRAVFLSLVLLFLASCAKKAVVPPKPLEPSPPVKQAPAEPQWEGPWERYRAAVSSLDLQGLYKAITTVLPQFDKEPPRTIAVEGKSFTSKEMKEKLLGLRDLIAADPPREKLFDYLSSGFEMVAIRPENKAMTLFTGYYVPTLEAKKHPDDIYKYPLYAKPPDMVLLRLSPLGPAFRNVTFTGRVDKKNRLVPYYTRREIDGEGALRGKKLEIAWLKDPLDALILQIQGSGVVVMSDGEICLAGFAGKNGHPYRSVGRYLSDNGYLPKEQVSWDNIRQFLKEHPEKFEEVIYFNPSYVFFALKPETSAIGSSRLPLVGSHSIAVDRNFVPPLSLCLIDLEKPVVGDDGLTKGSETFTELAFAMDEGSAITGPRRVDLFMGLGDEAARIAHRLRAEGELWVLVPKK